MRTLEELVVKDGAAWPELQRWVEQARQPVQVLPPERERAGRVLQALQVTTRSYLGALAYETGGVLVDHGWVRLLGSGHAQLTRDLAGWNRLDREPPQARLPGALLVGDDALGGFFALNGGGLPGAAGHVHYLAPDTWRWEDLGRGYAHFVTWLLKGDLTAFNQGLRWPGWEQATRELGADRGFSVYPFLWARLEPGQERSRRPVPMEKPGEAEAAATR